MKKKYKILKSNEKILSGRILHQVEALCDFSDVSAGTLGGFIEKEENLSHKGDCWLYDNSAVYDNARLQDNAILCNTAIVCENAIVGGGSILQNESLVYGHAVLSGEIIVSGGSIICDDVKLIGGPIEINSAFIKGDARLQKTSDVFVVSNIWSRRNPGTITYTRPNKMWTIFPGSFHGTGEELIQDAIESNESSTIEQYKLLIKYVESMYNRLEDNKI